MACAATNCSTRSGCPSAAAPVADATVSPSTINSTGTVSSAADTVRIEVEVRPDDHPPGEDVVGRELGGTEQRETRHAAVDDLDRREHFDGVGQVERLGRHLGEVTQDAQTDLDLDVGCRHEVGHSQRRR